MASLLKGTNLQKRDGDSYTKAAENHLANKVVALYFSAHWCPPCRQFTPVLKDFYEELDGEPLEIVFVSFDRSEDDMKNYMREAHGDWCVLPFGDPKIQELANKFGVSGIPALIVVKPDGTVIRDNARSDVQSKPPKTTFAEWKSAAGL